MGGYFYKHENLMHNQNKIQIFKCLGCGNVIIARRPKNGTKYCSLACFRRSKRPNRLTGEIIKCEFCGKSKYKSKTFLTHHLHHFCSLSCSNSYQARNKAIYICKVCKNIFKISKSLAESRPNKPKYCSIFCRNADKKHMTSTAINANLAQQNKNGLNKLELEGRNILNNMGIQFEEQVLMYNKFLVDILIKEKNLIIQWDGIYWHTRQKRMMLDISQDAYLNKCGYKILRITDFDIKHNKNEVCETIMHQYNN